ncbi:flagellar biosynthetic protein FliO [Peptococcaceae bacterium 1198_IL3148]
MNNTEILFAFIRVIIALPLVLALAYVAIKYGLARRGLVKGQQGGRRMRVVEQMPLGPKGLLSLVEVGDKYFLLAHAETGITVVKEYDTLPEPLADNTVAEGLPDFRQLLKFKLKQQQHVSHQDTAEGENGREK